MPKRTIPLKAVPGRRSTTTTQETETARLIRERDEALEQQKATAEILRVIRNSPADVQPVFETIVRSAVSLCGSLYANVFRFDGELLHFVAFQNMPPSAVPRPSVNWRDHLDLLKTKYPMRPGSSQVAGRVVLTKSVVRLEDALTDLDYDQSWARAIGFRRLLGVPMLHEGQPLGVIVVGWTEAGPVPKVQEELLKTFADQAVIAIENARLLNELRRRTTDLSKSLEELRTTQDRLVQTEKLASLGQLTAGIAHEIKNPLNFINNFSGVSTELIGELQDTLSDISIDSNRRAELNELTDTLRGNLEKVVQHGRRADAIVKSMLLHSGETSGEHRPTDINALVDESLTRAYYNARAEHRGFTIKLERSFDPTVGEADLYPREITRALLNLIANGFYAATRRNAEAKGGDREPTLVAATKSLGDRVEIRIRDNGSGIPADVKGKMFDPFFTTKPTGEGTGLGLSISHDIVVKQHGGSIEVDTVPGEFAEFRVVLPRSPSR